MNYKLGLDMGASSIGWAIVELDKNNKPQSLKDLGVRIFSDSRDAKSKTPDSVKKRMAKGARVSRDKRLMRTLGLITLH